MVDVRSRSSPAAGRWDAPARGASRVAGALLAALLLPWIVGPGLAARSSANLLSPLPGELADEHPGRQHRRPGRRRLADHLLLPEQPDAGGRRADRPGDEAGAGRHRGLAVLRAPRARRRGHRCAPSSATCVAGSVVEGGSTITQQLVKQTLLQTAATAEEREAATEESVGRKLREARLALPWSSSTRSRRSSPATSTSCTSAAGAYGIQAAAQRYFSVNAADLTLPQAAMLAGLVQTPANDDPITNPDGRPRAPQPGARSGCTTLGHITDEELAEIPPQPVAVAPSPPPPNGCVDAVVGASSATTCSGT